MSNDKNNLVYREQLDDNVIEMLSEDIGSNYSLRTENTKTIVAALNEILGKDIICNAIGEPLLTTDTFAQMGEKIKGLTDDFKAKLLRLGISVSNIDKLESLIAKLGNIDLGADNEEVLTPFIKTLSDILINAGVVLNGDENLGDLIIKVDVKLEELNNGIRDLNETLNNKNTEMNELNNTITLLNNQVNSLTSELAGKVTPAGTAVAGHVLSGQTFINSTGQVITGTMPSMGSHTKATDYIACNETSVYIGIPQGAYINLSSTGQPEIYVEKSRLDSNLRPENIVQGKSICGVWGTAMAAKIVAGDSCLEHNYTAISTSNVIIYDTSYDTAISQMDVIGLSKVMRFSGTVTCSYMVNGSGPNSHTSYHKLVVYNSNGTIVQDFGEIEQRIGTSVSGVTYNVTVNKGDKIVPLVRTNGSGGYSHVSEFTIKFNLQI